MRKGVLEILGNFSLQACFLGEGKGLTFPVNLMATVLVGAGYMYRPNGGDAS